MLCLLCRPESRHVHEEFWKSNLMLLHLCSEPVRIQKLHLFQRDAVLELATLVPLRIYELRACCTLMWPYDFQAKVDTEQSKLRSVWNKEIVSTVFREQQHGGS